MVQRSLSSSGNQDSHTHDHRNGPHRDQSQVYQCESSAPRPQTKLCVQPLPSTSLPPPLVLQTDRIELSSPRPQLQPPSTPSPAAVPSLTANPEDPNGPPPPDDPGTAGSTVTTGSPLCRDFTGSGAIATSVFSYSISRSVGQDSYIVDWDIQNQIDCCNKCASVPLGCSFWRYQDSCLMVVNPRRVDTCPRRH
ncbi:hypothetical protein K440DRAFT_664644 [Wilcoxina mikolae CBS 423.85]|nr:hypothetical protein K440DRAFT_664644 [Wilcoxina mikolae CBS 423.85]